MGKMKALAIEQDELTKELERDKEMELREQQRIEDSYLDAFTQEEFNFERDCGAKS